MPKIKANGITINYEQTGVGEPLILIPHLGADNACYAFQVADYAEHFTCISIDPRGVGETDKPAADYSTELFADDVAAFMQAIGVERAHISGLSLGAATGMWLAAKYPWQVKSLSLHSAWPKTDLFLKTVVECWQGIAKSTGDIAETTIRGIFPWCFTPELYAANPLHIAQLAGFVRSRPKQPLDAFIRQSNAVISHDVLPHIGEIKAPTQITFGEHDVVTSVRFAGAMRNGINENELVVFEASAHTPIYENVTEFNQKTLSFLRRQIG